MIALYHPFGNFVPGEVVLNSCLAPPTYDLHLLGIARERIDGVGKRFRIAGGQRDLYATSSATTEELCDSVANSC